MTLDFHFLKFSELTTTQLYDLLGLRSEIFVVEQNCVYQDIDHKDRDAIHVLGYEQDQLVAYARLFEPQVYFDLCSIGRVAVKKEARGKNYGHALIKASLGYIFDNFGPEQVKISAQVYLKSFYKYWGFKPIGEEYLEDGIPHITMIRDASPTSGSPEDFHPHN